MAEPQSNFAQYREERRSRRQGSDQESETVQEGGFAQYKAEREAKRNAKRTKTMTRGEVIPLMAREGLEWGTSDESEGARRTMGLPKWADKAINATPMGTFANIGMGLGAIGAEAAGANMPDTYTETRDAKRADINQAREEYPVTSMASEIAGGVAYPGGAMKGGAPLVKQVPRMAALGGAQGGIYGFNAAEGDLGDRTDAAKTGAAFGAALGGALPIGVAGARVPARSIKNTGASIYDGLLGLFGKEGGARASAAEQTALAAVKRSMERSQMTPQQILDAVREYEGKPAVLAEVIGQDAVNALTSLTRRPGSTPQKAQAIIEERYGGFVDRAQDDLERATGVRRGQASEQFSQLVEDQQKVARPLYNQLSRDFADINSDRLDDLSKTSAIKPLVSAKKPKDLPPGASTDLPDDMSPELEAWAQSLLAPPPDSGLKPLSGAAVQEARDLAIAQGRDPKSVSRMDVYDLVKRKLDDKIRAAQKNENHTDLNRYSQIREALVDELDALTGSQYKAARDAGMGPRLRTAQSQGGRVLNSNIRGADVAQTAASSPQEARALKLGAVDALSAKIDNNTTPNRLARVPANQEKLTAALGEDGGGQFLQKMEAEAKLRDTGSRWAPRMNSVTGTVAESGPSAVMDDAIMMGAAAARGDKVSLITNAVRFMRRRGFNQREIDAMGDLLLSNPAEGLRRLGVQLPNGGGGGAPANVFAQQGQMQQAPAQADNVFAPVKASGLAGLRSDAGSAAVGGAVGGAMPADSTEERLRNIGIGAGGVLAAKKGGRAYRRELNKSVSRSVRTAAPRPARGNRGPITNSAYERAYEQAVAQTGIRKADDPQNHAVAIDLLTNAGFSREYADDIVAESMRALDRAALKQGGGLRVVGGDETTTSGMGLPSFGGAAGLRADAGNAAMGGAVGGMAPADNMEDRVRNIAIGAGVGATGGRLDRMLPKMGQAAPKTVKEAVELEIPGSAGWEAARAKGLDMSQSGRMQRAQEMGFDTRKPLYHGTGEDFQAFDLGAEARWGIPTEGKGIFMTDRPSVATEYAQDGANQNVMKLFASIERPMIVNKAGMQVDDVDTAALIERAKAEGYDSLILRNARDGVDAVTEASDVTVVFDPAKIRSVNAAFDPDMAASPVMTAGIGGGKLPKIRKDVPKGTPSQAGPSRMGNTIQQGLDQSSGMGAARAVGDPQLVRQQAFQQAQKMYTEGNAKPAQIHQQTGYVPLEYQGQQILVYAPDKTPDEVMIGFYSAIANPAQASPAQLRLLETAGVLPKTLQLGGADAPVVGRRSAPAGKADPLLEAIKKRSK